MAEPRRASDRGDPLATRALDALRRDAFDDVARMLREQDGVDAEIRAHAVAAMPGLAAPLRRWRERSPADPVLHLLLGIRRLDDVPWLVAELEERTAEQQHYDEVESLWRAVEHLQWAQGDGLAAASTWMAAVVGALAWRGAMPLADFHQCAKGAEELVPNSLQVARWRVHLADPGDGTDPVRFAEESAQEWPAGDPRHAEVITAHMPQYHDLLIQDANTAPEYWRRDDVMRSVLACNERLVGCTGLAAFDASSLLAFVLPRTKQPRLSIPHFDRLNGRVMTWPWAIMQSPVAAFVLVEQQGRRSLRGMFRRN